MSPIIQFLGLPGSGKTYLFNNLIKALNERWLGRVIGRHEAVLMGLRHRDNGFITNLIKNSPASFWHRVIHENYCLQEYIDFQVGHLGLTGLIAEVLQQAELRTLSTRSILGSIASTCVEHQLINVILKKKHLLLADEWFFHRFYTLFGNCCIIPTQKQIEMFIQNVPLSEGVVFIATPPSVCLDRMVQRNRFPQIFFGLPREEIEKSLIVGHLGLTALLATLQEQGQKVYIYDGVSPDIEPIVKFCQTVIS